MANKDSLLSFFEAENKRDWSAYRKFLSPDVVWLLYSKQTKTIEGIGAYLTTMMDIYNDNDNTFACEALYQSSDENRIVAILRNNLGERSCDVFEFSGGLIVKEYEFIITSQLPI